MANEWGDELKAKKLPTLLEGKALAVWLELTTKQQGTYQMAKSKIVERMAPVHFVSLDELWAQKLQPNEALSVYLHQLKQLLRWAMLDVDAGTRDQLLRHHFVSELPIVIN